MRAAGTACRVQSLGRVTTSGFKEPQIAVMRRMMITACLLGSEIGFKGKKSAIVVVPGPRGRKIPSPF